MKKVSYLLTVDPLTQTLEGNGQFFETVRVGDGENGVKWCQIWYLLYEIVVRELSLNVMSVFDL